MTPGRHEAHGEGEHLLGEPLPLEVPDDAELPVDDVAVSARMIGADGATYWYWSVPGYRESAVGYAAEAVARRKGAEFLRAQRQKRAMREGGDLEGGRNER